jgi:hypothetical protein
MSTVLLITVLLSAAGARTLPLHLATTAPFINIALNTKLTFSAQELISCANYSCGEGAWPNNGLLYMTKQGLPSEACYPLSGSETSEARALASVLITIMHRVTLSLRFFSVQIQLC